MGLRIGVIGVGGLGYLQAKTYRELESVTIVAAADVAEEARDLFEDEFDAPAYQNCRELLQEHAAEMDAVTIVTPHTLHYDQAIACLERDLHVLIEKPMVTDVDRAVDIVELATERDLTVQIGYQRHFHPAFEYMRSLIEQGAIGDIHSVNCFISQDWFASHRDTWRVNPSFAGGGQLYDTGSHLLEALLWLTGGEPRTVSAQIEYGAPSVDINTAATIELEVGSRSAFASVAIIGNGDQMVPSEGYFVWGTNGSLKYVDDTLTVTRGSAAPYYAEIPSDFDFTSLNRRKLENFVASILSDEEPAVPADIGLEVTVLTEALYEAAETGERIDLDSFIDAHDST